MTTTTDTNDYGRFAPSDWCINDDYIRVFGGFRAPDPRPGVGGTHAVTHDLLIGPDGSVSVQINGGPLEDLPHGPSSHIP